MRLELIGGFNTEVRTPRPDGNGYSVSIESREIPIIHGVSGNERFTLLGNIDTHTSGLGFFDGEIVEQDWSANRALRGIHLQSLGEQVFTHGYLQLEGLLQWSNTSALDLTHVMEPGKVGGERRASTHEELERTAVFGDMKIGLRVRRSDFSLKNRPVSNRRFLESVEWATLKFELPAPVAYDAFDRVAKDLQDLLSLSAYAPCGALSRSLMYETSETHPGSRRGENEVEVMGRQIYRTTTGEDKSESSHRLFVFTLAEMDFPDIVPKWLDLKDRVRTGCEILFGLRYIGIGYVGTRLLGVASAAESVHTGLCSASTPMPKIEYRKLKRKLLDALEDEPDEIKEFVKNGLRNNPTYNDRVLELASIPDAEAVDRLLTDRSRWASMLKNARNDLAHANERSSRDPEATPAFWLLEVTYALLCLVLMSELGIGAEAQRSVLGRPRVNWASFQFKKFLHAKNEMDSPE